MNIDERIQNMLISDKHFDAKDLVKVLKSDFYNLLVNYLEISPQDIILELNIDEFGEYVIKLQVKTERLKIFGSQIN